jgi:hypothetical protein
MRVSRFAKRSHAGFLASFLACGGRRDFRLANAGVFIGMFIFSRAGLLAAI